MSVLRSRAGYRPLAAHGCKWGALLLLASSCAPQVPAGRYACATDDDCPSGWVCDDNADGEGRCYPSDTDHRPSRDKQPSADKDGGEGDGSTLEPTQPPSAGTGAQAGAGSAPAAGSGGGRTPAAGSGGPTEPSPAGSPAPPPDPTECEADAPEGQAGVFVSPAGSDGSNCGSEKEPCASIVRAMDRAQADGRKFVYLETGEYAESIELRAGLSLRGGYENDRGQWTRNCSADRATLTRIQAPSEVGVFAEYDGEAVIETLTIATQTEIPPGRSAYGVFARGSATRLRLREVHVLAAAGGDGPRGVSGATPPPRTGHCVPGSDGANGETEGAPGAGASAGVFDSSGYVPGDGAPGGPGVPGHNGAIGTATCRNCLDACNPTTCSGSIVGQSCGQPGEAGCGGTGAAGGGGGGGGGSSIALFAWGARVEVEGGLLQAGPGGSGGAGGEPGQGGLGSEGSLGVNGESCTICSKSSIIPINPPIRTKTANAQASEQPPIDPDRPFLDAGIIAPPTSCVGTKAFGVGGPGTRGGMGSSGGLGGGGAGGHSYGAVADSAAVLDISNTTRVQFGLPGRSQGNGVAGVADDIRIVR